jgi:3-hydroxyisobutyrate dehydrogenase-like beta-hydroxyacid dehydrogenase
MKLGFIGLGNMGMPIARNLLRAGHQLIVWNRTRDRAVELQADGARVANSPAEACQAEVVFSMLADDRAVEQVFFSPGDALASMPQTSLHVSLSTISVDLSKRLAEAHQSLEQGFVAAPVFGRPEAAAAAQLVVAAAGGAVWTVRCRPLLEIIARKVEIVGSEPPQANAVKLSGNLLIASMLETLGEAFAMVRKFGVEPKTFLEVVNGGLFQSPVYENYGTMIAERRFQPAGFRMTLGLKDIRLLLAAGDSAEVPTPVASLVRDRFLTGIARGKGDLDWAGIAEVAAESAGIS